MGVTLMLVGIFTFWSSSSCRTRQNLEQSSLLGSRDRTNFLPCPVHGSSALLGCCTSAQLQEQERLFLSVSLLHAGLYPEWVQHRQAHTRALTMGLRFFGSLTFSPNSAACSCSGRVPRYSESANSAARSCRGCGRLSTCGVEVMLTLHSNSHI